MIYKKIEIHRAILSSIHEETAKEFIDHRINLKKPLTQGGFDRSLRQAIKCESSLPISANEAFEITIDKGWVGVTFEYIQTHLHRLSQARQESIAREAIQSTSKPKLVSDNTRRPIEDDLNDRSWAE